MHVVCMFDRRARLTFRTSFTQVADQWYLSADMTLECYDIWWYIFGLACAVQMWFFLICLPITQWEMVRRLKSLNVEEYLRVIFDEPPVEKPEKKEPYDPYACPC